MKKLIITSLMVVSLTLPALAITGLGFGIHAGQTVGYKYEALEGMLGDIADTLGIPADELTFDEELFTIGAHLKVATLPIVDFFVFADYSWKKKEIYNNLDFRLSDFAVGASAKKGFGAMLIKPFVGAGLEMHNLAYSLESDDAEINGVPVSALVVPDNQNRFGFHILGGVELNLPVFPIDPYVQYKYNWITTEDKATKYGLIEAGLTMSI